uniref:Uncharacterized protein n=1 Tax=Caenorhabditis tropicalis TaxID=1561998 RepID=A0A1I7UDK7_9PELO
MPESKKEFEVLAKEICARNISKPHAIDGELSPKCKAKLYAAQDKGAKFNVTTIKGDCNYKKNIYFFDDEFTDPTFALSIIGPQFPLTYGSFSSTGKPTFRHVADCLRLDGTHDTKERKKWYVVNTDYCSGASNEVTSINITSVICGRRPL